MCDFPILSRPLAVVRQTYMNTWDGLFTFDVSESPQK